jgi:2-polyprenyl-3-methyl-5-hydroxy-6-metoxy-1,4-benzoquinol methylase
MGQAVEPGGFDLVTARAVLHHVADAERAIANLVASLRPGGAILLIEPDFLPVTIAEPPEVRAFWSGWLAWSRDRGIDYQIGRTLAPRLAALGLEKIGGIAESVIYNGTSLWAGYWTRTIKELRQDLTGSGKLDNALWKRSSVIAPIPPGGRKRSLSLEFTVTPLVRE